MNKFITLHGLSTFLEELKSRFALIASPTFTGTVTASAVTVTSTLKIPGGKVWIA